jgi:acyl-CoA synthetase (AMP-forming)/AMP-acid ligase II
MNEKKLLIVECKAPGLEGQGEIWFNATQQLEGYLKAITTTNRKFGAIAVGKYVRFYELTDGVLAAFGNDSDYYLLDRQCQSITAKLAYFKANHR